ncbi:MAG TPA: hypothetical protein VM900_00910 [Sphingomonas sp.]|jgi:hypothetical protein|nr:hypothetical protein [Sphingomonas sp.]
MTERLTRTLYCVLGVRSLGYAVPCIASLVRNCTEDFTLTVLTDSAADAVTMRAQIEPLFADTAHQVVVHDQAHADALAAERYGAHPAVAAFRHGHPCWRKVTDPALYAAAGEEVIILDPDVYFPNRFAFEPTPATGLLLMWQRPNCLLPEPLVTEAYTRGVAMADHTDIGVCQFRAPLDLDFLESLLTTLDTAPYARSMHVESVVWAALAEHVGGGYLDPTAWHCFANSIPSRLARRMGRSGADTLAQLDFTPVKAFHAGGTAKTWLVDAERAGLFAQPRTRTDPTPVTPFVDYPRAKFEGKLRNRRLAKQIGLYKVLGSG